MKKQPDARLVEQNKLNSLTKKKDEEKLQLEKAESLAPNQVDQNGFFFKNRSMVLHDVKEKTGFSEPVPGPVFKLDEKIPYPANQGEIELECIKKQPYLWKKYAALAGSVRKIKISAKIQEKNRPLSQSADPSKDFGLFLGVPSADGLYQKDTKPDFSFAPISARSCKLSAINARKSTLEVTRYATSNFGRRKKMSLVSTKQLPLKTPSESGPNVKEGREGWKERKSSNREAQKEDGNVSEVVEIRDTQLPLESTEVAFELQAEQPEILMETYKQETSAPLEFVPSSRSLSYKNTVLEPQDNDKCEETCPHAPPPTPSFSPVHRKKTGPLSKSA
ncbi:uncharacterized protein LOC102346284 [Latimeria chalumnae]|uniref:uncharacterized protein LOC102346284 n=1 Tax=Latimeria chalumnae TaxID=7897 RepID=UPI00313AAE75